MGMPRSGGRMAIWKFCRLARPPSARLRCLLIASSLLAIGLTFAPTYAGAATGHASQSARHSTAVPLRDVRVRPTPMPSRGAGPASAGRMTPQAVGSNFIPECNGGAMIVFQASFICGSCNTTYITAGDGGIYGLINGGCGGRIWAHQNADGTGFAYCYNSPNSRTAISTGLGTLSAGNVQFTTNADQCTSKPPVGSVCDDTTGTANVLMYYNLSAVGCLTKNPPYTWKNPPGTFQWIYGLEPGRIWFHQNPDGTGWAECANPAIFNYIWGNSRDQHPGNIQLTTNSSPC
jgi:hypothetical protein